MSTMHSQNRSANRLTLLVQLHNDG